MMGKNKPKAQALVRVKPSEIEEPEEVYVTIPRTQFPERLKIIGSGWERIYSQAELEKHYEDAVEICRKNGHASCYEWMARLGIGYGGAVYIMDIMEYRMLVKPLEYKNGVAVSSGPRQFTKKQVWRTTAE